MITVSSNDCSGRYIGSVVFIKNSFPLNTVTCSSHSVTLLRKTKRDNAVPTRIPIMVSSTTEKKIVTIINANDVFLNL